MCCQLICVQGPHRRPVDSSTGPGPDNQLVTKLAGYNCSSPIHFCKIQITNVQGLNSFLKLSIIKYKPFNWTKKSLRIKCQVRIDWPIVKIK
jgi:hypothetical protein